MLEIVMLIRTPSDYFTALSEGDQKRRAAEDVTGNKRWKGAEGKSISISADKNHSRLSRVSACPLHPLCAAASFSLHWCFTYLEYLLPL